MATAAAPRDALDPPFDRAGKLAHDKRRAREAFRAQMIASVPDWYSPWLHLLFPSVVGIGVMGLCLALLRDLQAFQLLTVPLQFLVSNAAEWRLHRDVLHRRQPIGGTLYDRHTPIHHRLFVEEDMALRSLKEFRMILIPAYGILAIFFVTLPMALFMGWLGQRNVGLLFLFTCMGYSVSYEWLHLAYHLPTDHPIAQLSLIQRLRRHHARHHRPELMQRWNFNVSVPLWDFVRGTIHRE